jgi:hydrogenase nickel incorporation protein HypA/HybF
MMHELSIAASIVDLAEEEAANRGVRVLAVHLELGPLAGVVREALLGSFEIAAAGTVLERARLVIRETSIVVFCPICQMRRTPVSMQWMHCPECGTPTPEVLAGAELQVTGLEVTEEAKS